MNSIITISSVIIVSVFVNKMLNYNYNYNINDKYILDCMRSE
jgi:hypothetical protein